MTTYAMFGQIVTGTAGRKLIATDAYESMDHDVQPTDYRQTERTQPAPTGWSQSDVDAVLAQLRDAYGRILPLGEECGMSDAVDACIGAGLYDEQCEPIGGRQDLADYIVWRGLVDGANETVARCLQKAVGCQHPSHRREMRQKRLVRSYQPQGYNSLHD